MPNIDIILGPLASLPFLIVLAGSLVVYLTLYFLARRGVVTPIFRDLDAYDAVSEQVGRAVESGGRVHVSLGPNSIIDEDTGTTIASLAVLDMVADNATVSDRSPLVTTADATTYPVMDDVLRRAYRRRGAFNKYDHTSSQLAALDSITLAGQVTTLIEDEDVQANVLVGSFGSEVALILEAGSRRNISQTVGSDRVEAQAAAYGASDHVLIGEELFVSRAYLEENPGAAGAVAAQDVLRGLAIGAIIVGAILTAAGVI